MEQPQYDFFLVVLPGWEDLAQQEVFDWFPHLLSKASQGGILVQAPLATGLSMNLCLKVPTRILVRVSEFRCRDFPKLFRRFSAIPWDLWIGQAPCAIEVTASSSRSRLKIKKRIEETCKKAWLKRDQKSVSAGSFEEKLSVYVRLSDDLCTISIDTSGERLHRRGLRHHVGVAPLRETIAASLILILGKYAPIEKPVEIIDPMMGSGTVLIEALMRDQVVGTRDFAFSRLVCNAIAAPVLASRRPTIARLLGIESDQKTFQAACHNLKGLPKSDSTEIFCEDFVKWESQPGKDGLQRWVIVNPPYGERLALSQPLGEYYSQLLFHIERVFQPHWVACLLPRNTDQGQLAVPVSWKLIEKRKFSNGGIPVWAMVFKGKESKSVLPDEEQV